MMKNIDFISFGAITDTVSVAFATTVVAKYKISAKQIQALI
jgi:hypothetical protein